MATDKNIQSLRKHLEVLWMTVMKIVAVTVVFVITAFFFKEQLFDVILTPKNGKFITYRLLNRIILWAGNSIAPFSIRFINTEFAQQFIIHMKTVLCTGMLCTSPYILYQPYRFVSPVLYNNEQQYVTRMLGDGYVMSYLRVMVRIS